MKRNLILASASPRRIAMMQAHGFTPRIFPANIEENLPLFHGMTQTPLFLALKKAKAVEAAILNEPGMEVLPPIIIAADTIVYKNGIMGKPESRADAMAMLQTLRGTMHEVVTGVALSEVGRQNTRVFYEVTKVFFTDYSDQVLHTYLDTDEAYDKAGGYAIQGYFRRFVDHIEGDYDNVVGFPWTRIMAELEKFCD